MKLYTLEVTYKDRTNKFRGNNTRHVGLFAYVAEAEAAAALLEVGKPFDTNIDYIVENVCIEVVCLTLYGSLAKAALQLATQEGPDA